MTQAELGAAPALQCDGDGTSGLRIQAIYAVATDRADRFDEYGASLEAWGAFVQEEWRRSAAKTGGDLAPRFVHTPTAGDGTCSLQIDRVTLSASGDDSLTATTTELQAMGYDRADRKYLLWVDADRYCGVGTVRNDDSVGAGNANNSGPSYGRVDPACWNWSESHEIMHNLGGVQLSAPHSTGGWHCTDEFDRMCYAESSSVSVYEHPSCPYDPYERILDCNEDDYFNAFPAAGSYLAEHWNVARSLFVFDPDTPEPTPLPPLGPVVSITAPDDGATVSGEITVTGLAGDDNGTPSVVVTLGAQERNPSVTWDGHWSTTFDVTGWVNGTYTLGAQASNGSASSPPAQRTLVVDNPIVEPPTEQTDTHQGELSKRNKRDTWTFTTTGGDIAIVLTPGGTATEVSSARDELAAEKGGNSGSKGGSNGGGKPGSSSDWALELRDSTGTPIAESRDPITVTLETTVAAGDYTVIVTGPYQPYTITITYLT